MPGEAAFGYFQPEALIDQVGLDRGNSPAPLACTLSGLTRLDLRLPDLFHSPIDQT